MNHKWLETDAPSKEILAVQITNVTLPTADSLETESVCVKSDEPTTGRVPETKEDDEDKENSLNHSESSEKSPSTNFTSSVGAKLVLEKSLSISLFPDAPTTPKVCRKMLYDDQDDLNTQVKEIVKKYQTSENLQQQQQQKTFASNCCTEETSSDCHLCHQNTTPTKPPSIEIDKRIICWAQLFL